jgi:hypothetical protein
VSAAVSKASAVHSTLVLPGDRTSQGVLALRVDAPLNLTVKLRDANGASCDFCASDALKCSLIEDGNGAVGQPAAHAGRAL